jgi:hypothetical protein
MSETEDITLEHVQTARGHLAALLSEAQTIVSEINGMLVQVDDSIAKIRTMLINAQRHIGGSHA